MKRAAVVAGAVLLLVGGLVGVAEEVATTTDRFRACDNVAGSGFFWLDTTTGEVWWMDAAACRWVYAGAPEGAQPGPPGTYLPRRNTSGEGMFVLNTATGEGWWTNGRGWKRAGAPQRQRH